MRCGTPAATAPTIRYRNSAEYARIAPPFAAPRRCAYRTTLLCELLYAHKVIMFAYTNSIML